MAAYPRVQTVVTFIVCATAVIGVATYVYGGSFLSSKDKKVAVVETVTTSFGEANPLIETADWKQAFFEINESSKKSYSTDTAKSLTFEQDSVDLTATDVLGREFFSKFMTLRQAGMISNTEATNALVDQIVEDGQFITDGPKIYSIKDLHISATEDNASRQIYANAVATALKRNRPTENEAVIAKDALERGDDARLADIDPIIAVYASVRGELLGLYTPPSVAEYHLNLINGLSGALANAISFRNAATDPLQALTAVSNYQTVEADIFYTVVDMRSYFDDNDIVFTPDEPAFSVFSMK